MFYTELPTIFFLELWNIKIGNVHSFSPLLFYYYCNLLIIVRFYYHRLHGVTIFVVFLTGLSR